MKGSQDPPPQLQFGFIRVFSSQGTGSSRCNWFHGNRLGPFTWLQIDMSCGRRQGAGEAHWLPGWVGVGGSMGCLERPHPYISGGVSLWVFMTLPNIWFNGCFNGSIPGTLISIHIRSTQQSYPAELPSVRCGHLSRRLSARYVMFPCTAYFNVNSCIQVSI